MEWNRLTRRIVAVACAAAVASFMFAGSAFAATVHGADYYGSGSALGAGEVDVLNVDGAAGEKVFLTVKLGEREIAKRLPYAIDGSSGGTNPTGEWAGVATLDITGLTEADLNGSYTIEAYASPTGNDLLYAGNLYGVYADLPDGTSKLIGTRTVNAQEATTRAFTPAETLYVGGSTYRLNGGATGDTTLHFPYAAYDETTTVDGVVKYVDGAGNVIASTKIPGLANNEERTVQIPAVVTGKDGNLYRTVSFQSAVVAKNPGRTSFSIYCTKMSDAAQTLSGYYVATIQMVDADGNVIAADSVDVTGEFLYTAPSVIYKTETVNAHTGETAVVTYRLAPTQGQTLHLNAATDGVENHANTLQVHYEAQPLEAAQTTVTFNLIDGSKRVKEEGRSLGTVQQTVTKQAPTVQPESQLQVNGTTYNLVGDPQDYAYTLGSGAVPTIDVYYTPEGYQAPGSYDVQVNYVNFLTGETIESHSYVSDSYQNARVTIDTPAEFSANGVDYVRLAGQEEPIAHSYYSGIMSYTVYYRDVNDQLSAGVVINRIRVVYEDNTTNAEGAGASTTAGTGAAAGAGAEGQGATALQLSAERLYNVMGGLSGNALMTNESGVDSNTERIQDSETPLSSGLDKSASSSAASLFTSPTTWVAFGVAVVVAVIAAILLIAIRRRGNDETFEM